MGVFDEDQFIFRMEMKRVFKGWAAFPDGPEADARLFGDEFLLGIHSGIR